MGKLESQLGKLTQSHSNLENQHSQQLKDAKNEIQETKSELLRSMPAPVKDFSQSEEVLNNLPQEVQSKRILTTFINELIGNNSKQERQDFNRLVD